MTDNEWAKAANLRDATAVCGVGLRHADAAAAARARSIHSAGWVREGRTDIEGR